MLYNVWKYFKNPKYREYHNASNTYKKTVFLSLLKWNLLICLALGLIVHGISTIFELETGEHSLDILFANKPIWYIFLAASILAPILEETLFRGPLAFFKHSRFFKCAFYASILLFGIVHIFNFEGDNELYYLTPLLVAPQLVTGVFLGYIRVKLGLKWSIFLHASFNTILIGPILLMSLLNIPME